MSGVADSGYRLVLDIQATQNPAHAHRGIGRYVKEHTRALLDRSCVDALVLNPHLPFPRELDGDLLCSPMLGWNTLSGVRAVAERAQGTLAYHVMSPFELGAHAEGELPAHVLHDDVPLVVTLYDLIPLVESLRYAGDPERARGYHTRSRFLAQADLVLAISEHTAAQAVEHLDIEPARVVTIGAGVSSFFHPAHEAESPGLILGRDLPAVTRPYVLAVAGSEPRKNTERLIDVWSSLPPRLRADHQLVLACHVDDGTRSAWTAHADAAGLGPGAVVLTGWVSDEVLRALYQRARLFVLPSLSEGFGLPAAEAIACGCPSLTSSTSSLPEVLAWPPATFDPLDVADMAHALERGLTDEAHRRELVERGSARGAELTWAAVAERTVTALARLGARDAGARAPGPADLASPSRTTLPLRIALVGPMPPTPSGIADYNAQLLPHLAERCELDVFSPGPRPPRSSTSEVRWFPPGALKRNLNPWSYDAVVYTVGNSDDHHDLYDQAEELPGLLWMHDVRLPGLYLTYARKRVLEENRQQFLMARLLHQYRRRLPEGVDYEVATARPDEYVDAGLGLSKELVDAHRGVVVSNEIARRLLALDQQPDARPPRVWVVPHAVPEALVERLRRDDTVVVSFGMVAPVKAPDLVIRAFAATCTRAGADDRLRDARLVFVGQVNDADRTSLVSVAEACRVGERVSFTGLVDRADYESWMSRADLAVQLRRATNGESSGAVHECIGTGVPVITNVASAVELPPGVVELVPHDVDVVELADRMTALLTETVRVERQRHAQTAYAEAWGFAQVAERLLEIVAALGPTLAAPDPDWALNSPSPR